jgi:negative regulator of replication initiation
MEEKRKAVRVEKPLIIQYAHSSSDLVKPLVWDSTTAKNISIEGMLLNTDKIFAKNEKFLLRFVLLTDSVYHLEFVAEVIESLPYRTRIKFINLDEQQKKIISDYLGVY